MSKKSKQEFLHKMRKGEANGMPLFLLVYNPIMVVILAWKELICILRSGSSSLAGQVRILD